MWYAIQARSRRANHCQRFMDEDELKGRRTTNRQLALRKAEAWAERLNQRRLLGQTDWSAEIEEITSPFKPL
jgi:hypothetical protein